MSKPRSKNKNKKGDTEHAMMRAMQAMVPRRPPAFQYTIKLRNQKARFIAGGGSGGAINQVLTVRCFAGWYVVGVTATTSSMLFSAVRIKRIRMWGTTAPCMLYCDFNGTVGGTIGESSAICDSSVGTTYVAYIDARPSKTSQASQWQAAGSAAPFCTINAPTGTIVEYTVDLRMIDTTQVVTPGPVLVGAVVGQFYYVGGDFASNAATTLIADGPPNFQFKSKTLAEEAALLGDFPAPSVLDQEQIDANNARVLAPKCCKYYPDCVCSERN